MRQVTFILPDGTPAPNTEFGEVAPGQTSAPRQVILKNTGDVDLFVVKVWIEQADTVDGQYQASAAGITVTGTSQETAQDFGPMSVGAAIYFTETFAGAGAPDAGVPVDTGVLRIWAL